MTRDAKSIRAAVALVVLLTAMVGCKPTSLETTKNGHKIPAPLTIKGSDTMVTLGQRWAEVYMQSHPDAIIQVTGGGSGTGISALINGTTDICQASRKMKPRETKMIADQSGSEAVEIPVALDGLAIYVHASNPLSHITFAQIKGVFTGKVTNWKELGGHDAKIAVYSRENNSGTYVYFKDAVLDGLDYLTEAQTMPGTAAVVNAVSKEPNAIGYGGAAYALGIKVLDLKRTDADIPITLSRATVKSGIYPLSRPLYFYLATPPKGTTKAFVDWVLGPRGQSLITQVGYYPLD